MMKECMVVNICYCFASSIAISFACYVTKSAAPLFAFLIIPKWTYSIDEEDKNE